MTHKIHCIVCACTHFAYLHANPKKCIHNFTPTSAQNSFRPCAWQTKAIRMHELRACGHTRFAWGALLVGLVEVQAELGKGSKDSGEGGNGCDQETAIHGYS